MKIRKYLISLGMVIILSFSCGAKGAKMATGANYKSAASGRNFQTNKMAPKPATAMELKKISARRNRGYEGGGHHGSSRGEHHGSSRDEYRPSSRGEHHSSSRGERRSSSKDEYGSSSRGDQQQFGQSGGGRGADGGRGAKSGTKSTGASFSLSETAPNGESVSITARNIPADQAGSGPFGGLGGLFGGNNSSEG